MAARGGREKGIRGRVDDLTLAVREVAARTALYIWAHWTATPEKEELIRQTLEREVELKIRPAITALNNFLTKYSRPPASRWPCPDCGRTGKDQPMRILSPVVSTPMHHRGQKLPDSGCYLCNMDELLQEGWRALQQLRAQ